MTMEESVQQLYRLLGPGVVITLDGCAAFSEAIPDWTPVYRADTDETGPTPSFPCPHGCASDRCAYDCTWCKACHKWARDNGSLNENDAYVLNCLHRTGYWNSEAEL